MLFRNDKKDDKEIGGLVKAPLLPLRDIIVFPHMVVPLFVGRQRSIKALEEATQKQGLIFLSSQKDPKTNEPIIERVITAAELYGPDHHPDLSPTGLYRNTREAKPLSPRADPHCGVVTGAARTDG